MFLLKLLVSGGKIVEKRTDGILSWHSFAQKLSKERSIFTSSGMIQINDAKYHAGNTELKPVNNEKIC